MQTKLRLSFSPKNTIISEYGHLGVRIQRLLSKPENLLSKPTCDISVHELQVLLRGSASGRSIRQNNSSFLRVEIAPLVSTVIAWPGRTPQPQLSLFSQTDSPDEVVVDPAIAKAVASLKAALEYLEKAGAVSDRQVGQQTTKSKKRK